MRIDQQRLLQLIAIFSMAQLAAARAIEQEQGVNEGAVVVAQDQGFALGQNPMADTLYAATAVWLSQNWGNYMQPNFDITGSVRDFWSRWTQGEIDQQSAIQELSPALEENLIPKQNLDPVDCDNGYICVAKNVVQNRSSDVVLEIMDQNQVVVSSKTVNLFTEGNQLINDIKSFTFGNSTYVAVGYGSNLADQHVTNGSGFAAGLRIFKIEGTDIDDADTDTDVDIVPPQILDVPIFIQGQPLSEVFLNVIFANDVAGNQNGVVITPGSDQEGDFLDVSWNSVNSPGVPTNVRLILKDGKFIPASELTPSPSQTPSIPASSSITPSRLVSAIRSVIASVTGVPPTPSNPAVSPVVSSQVSPLPSPTVSLSAFPQIITTASGLTYFTQNDASGSKGVFVRKGLESSVRVNLETEGDQVLLGAAKVNDNFDAATFLSGDGKLLVTMIGTSGSSLSVPVQDFVIEDCDENCRANIVVDPADSTKFSINIIKNGVLEIIGYVVDNIGNLVKQPSPTPSASESASKTGTGTTSTSPSPAPSVLPARFEFHSGDKSVIVQNINSSVIEGYSGEFIEKIVQFTKLDAQGNFEEKRLVAGSSVGNASNPCLVGSFLQSAAFQHPYIATSYNQNADICGMTIGTNGTNPDGTKIEVKNFDNLDVVRCKVNGTAFDNPDVNAFFGSIGKDYSRFTLQNIPNQADGATKFIFSHPDKKDKSLAVVIDQNGDCTLGVEADIEQDKSDKDGLDVALVAGASAAGAAVLSCLCCCFSRRCREKSKDAVQGVARAARVIT